MILLLDTSTAECRLSLYEGTTLLLANVWQADRELAEGLLGYILQNAAVQNKTLDDISGIGLMQGLGSFTGLRIGASICNAIAADRSIPIVGTTGEDWQAQALTRLNNGENDQIVLPDYGRPARITQPRK